MVFYFIKMNEYESNNFKIVIHKSANQKLIKTNHFGSIPNAILQYHCVSLRDCNILFSFTSIIGERK